MSTRFAANAGTTPVSIVVVVVIVGGGESNRVLNPFTHFFTLSTGFILRTSDFHTLFAIIIWRQFVRDECRDIEIYGPVFPKRVITRATRAPVKRFYGSSNALKSLLPANV